MMSTFWRRSSTRTGREWSGWWQDTGATTLSIWPIMNTLSRWSTFNMNSLSVQSSRKAPPNEQFRELNILCIFINLWQKSFYLNRFRRNKLERKNKDICANRREFTEPETATQENWDWFGKYYVDRNCGLRKKVWQVRLQNSILFSDLCKIMSLGPFWATNL